MQFIIISHQLLEALWAFLLGLFFAFLYDIIRFVRRILSPLGFEKLILNFLDLLYFVFCASAYCVFLYAASNGRFRAFTAVSVFAGFLIYRFLPGKIILALLNYFADLLNKTFCVLTYPVKIFFCFLTKCILSLLTIITYKIRIYKTDRIKTRLHKEVRL